MFIFCTGLHLWKRLWSFSSHWQKLFTTVTNNSQNRLLDGQTGERGAQAWKSQVSGIVQPLRCEMMHFETITKPENHLDTVSSRPVAASHHCLEVLAKNLEIQKKMSILVKYGSYLKLTHMYFWEPKCPQPCHFCNVVCSRCCVRNEAAASGGGTRVRIGCQEKWTPRQLW